ncbi:unnamed protein product [Lota lota]
MLLRASDRRTGPGETPMHIDNGPGGAVSQEARGEEEEDSFEDLITGGKKGYGDMPSPAHLLFFVKQCLTPLSSSPVVFIKKGIT